MLGRYLKSNNELLLVVLLRFRWPARIWAILLIMTNMGALFFIEVFHGRFPIDSC